MTQETTQISTEEQIGKYGELYQSLVRLSEVTPGLMLQTTKNGKPEVLTIPARDSKRLVAGYEVMLHKGQETVVAVSDNDIRVIDITPPMKSDADEMVLLIEANPISGYFRPDSAGQVMSEEEILAKIESARGQVAERPDQKLPIIGPTSIESGPPEGGPVLVYLPIKEEAKPGLILDAKQRILLKSLSDRSKENTRGQKSPYEKEFKAAFNPKSYRPGENLADIFNSLAAKLEAK